MKNGELFGLMELLNKLGDIRAAKFNYFVAKNKSKLTSELKDIQDVINNSDAKFKEFSTKRIDLNVQHSLKKDDKPIIENNSYQIDPAKRPEFDKAIADLREEYKEAIDAENQRMKSVQKFLEEDTKVSFYKIKQSDIPAEVTGNELALIIDLIEEN